MNIRAVTPADHLAIRAMLVAAFPTPGEADLVEQLRAGGEAAIELVAVPEDSVAGHILFSPMQAPLRALALAPVAVAPDRRRQGIGAALIRAGHERAREQGWDAIFVLGDPDYYQRFGYDVSLAASFASPYAGPYFMAVALGGVLPVRNGPVTHAPPFAALG